jgi:hypothetical protein
LKQVGFIFKAASQTIHLVAILALQVASVAIIPSAAVSEAIIKSMFQLITLPIVGAIKAMLHIVGTEFA